MGGRGSSSGSASFGVANSSSSEYSSEAFFAAAVNSIASDGFYADDFKQSKSDVPYLLNNPDSLSINKRLVINAYTSNVAYRLNENLRFGKNDTKTKIFERTLNHSLDSVANYKGEVRRAMTLKNAGDVLKKYRENVGGKIKYNSFLSTTAERSLSKSFTSENDSWNVIYVIRSKNGKRIKAYSNAPDENEVLFKSGSTFKIKRVDGNIVYLEE